MRTRLLAVVAVCSLSVAVTTVLVAQAPLKQPDGALSVEQQINAGLVPPVLVKDESPARMPLVRCGDGQ